MTWFGWLLIGITTVIIVAGILIFGTGRGL